MRPSEAKQVLAALLAAYPRVKLDEANVVAYAEALVDVDVDVGLTVARSLIVSHEGFPPIATILSSARIERTRIEREAARLAAPRSRPRDWREVGLAGLAAARSVLQNSSDDS